MNRRFSNVREEMEAVSVLPLFQEFLVRDNALYLVIFNMTGSDQTEIIRINETTEEAHYIDLPFNLRRIQIVDDLIYGIESTEEGPIIQMLKMTE